MENLFIKSFLVACLLETTSGAEPRRFVRLAKQYITSDQWVLRNGQTDTSNLFVARVLRDAWASLPTTKAPFNVPIKATEWANRNSHLLTGSLCWNLCQGQTQLGDVLAINDHVAIVTDYGKTTSASKETIPPGLIVENTWGFRTGQNPTCWRYQYDKKLCKYIMFIQGFAYAN